MSISRADVEHVAKLAHLELTPPEIGQLVHELGAILDYAACLETVDTTGVDPAESLAREAETLREDVVRPGLSAQTATAQAPQAERCLFKVPPAFDER